MNNKANKSRSRKFATKLIKDLNIKIAPVNLDVVIDYLDLETKPLTNTELKSKNLSGDISAFIEFSSNTIYYNSDHNPGRIRFSIAHEIGHYQLGHQTYPKVVNYDAKDPIEIEANTFAAFLLMPTTLMSKEKLKSATDITNLAAKYQVNGDTMRYRIFNDDILLGVKFDYKDYHLSRQEQLEEEISI